MMYTTNSELGASTVPAFLSKLWTLVEDPDTNELICWDVSGKSFHVLDQIRFAKEILPLYFKHNNIASFIRQLNMYGFRKVITVEAVNIKMEKDDLEFAHPYFVMGQEALLEFIKRKAPNPKAAESAGVGVGVSGVGGVGGHASEDISKVYTDVAAMKGRQDSMTSKLDHLKIENEVLWKEVIALRQRHLKQEQIVNKLIQFLVTLVGDRTLGGMKRKFPLMLQDGSAGSTSSSTDSMAPPTKVPRPNNTESPSPDLSSSSLPASASASAAQMKLRADRLEPLAIVRDGEMRSLQLTDLLEDVDESAVPMTDLFPSTDDIMPGRADETNVSISPDELILAPGHDGERLATVDDGQEIDILSLVEPSTLSSEPITTIARTDPTPPNLFGISDFDKTEMSTQLDHLQADLDHVRDLFTSGGTYNFDANTLFELPPSTDFSFPSFPFNMLFSPDASLLSSPKVLFSPDVAYLSTPSVLLDGDEDNELAALETSKSKSNDSHGTVIGNELIQYNPPEDYNSLFEQFASGVGGGGCSSFGDPMNLSGQDDLDRLFETNQLLRDTDLDLQ